MKNKDYAFLIPAVKDFPDEPEKKPRGTSKIKENSKNNITESNDKE